MEVEEVKPLLVRLLPRLRRFARTLAPTVADADDLVQTACLRALERSGDLASPERIAPWMFAMLRNAWIDETRRRSVRHGAGTVDAAEAADLQTPTDGAASLGARQITDHVLGLPQGLSAVVLLVSVEGYTYRETAEILGIPAGTVMSRMSRARTLIAAALAEIPQEKDQRS